MSDRRPSSDKVRRNCMSYWKVEKAGQILLPCHCPTCNGVLFVAANTRWCADHRIPREHGGSDDPPNVRPMRESCHLKKTAEVDIPAIAKGRRQADRVFGVKRSKGFRRPKDVIFDWSRGRYVKCGEES